MSNYTVHNRDSAPGRSGELLGGVEKAFGFIPNLSGVMAESPATLEVILAVSYKSLSNYINHIAETPLDAVSTSQTWSPQE